MEEPQNHSVKMCKAEVSKGTQVTRDGVLLPKTQQDLFSLIVVTPMRPLLDPQATLHLGIPPDLHLSQGPQLCLKHPTKRFKVRHRG